jgi:hypothetical protein
VGVPAELDLKRITRYPPEIFIQAVPVPLLAGSDTPVFAYTGIDVLKFIVQLYGLSFSPLTGGRFSLDVEGSPDVVKIESLDAIRGLDYEEEVRIPARQTLVGRIFSPTGVTAYAMRHKVRVDRATPFLKVLFGYPLVGSREVELARKYNMRRIAKTEYLSPLDPYRGLYRIKTYARTMSSSGVIARINVPKGWRVALLDIVAERPASPGQAYVVVERDEAPALYLDLYCLPSLSYLNRFEHNYSLLVNALDWLSVSLDVRASGTYKVRFIVGFGELLLQDKARWVPEELTSEERAQAEELNLFELVEAGLA